MKPTPRFLSRIQRASAWLVTLAIFGCNAYPSAPTSPTTQSAVQPAPELATSEPGSVAWDQEYSYSEGAPQSLEEVSALLDGRSILAHPIYDADCVKYRVMRYPTCEERIIWVEDPAPAATPVPSPSLSPSPKPSPSPTLPSAPRPSVKPRGENVFWFRATHYFSPNEDSVKDTARIDVVASADIGAWTLSVANAGQILAGAGPRLNYQWDGTVNGSQLSDGEYTLLLTRTATQTTVSAKVVIDNGKPTISDMKMEQDPSDETGSTFIFSAKVEDSGLAGLDLAKLKVEIKGATVAGTENPFYPQTGTISRKFTFAAEPGQTITADVTAVDKAGNQTIQNSGADTPQDVAELLARADDFSSQALDRLAALPCTEGESVYSLFATQDQFVDYTALRDAEIAAAWLVAHDSNVSAGARAAALFYWAELNNIPTSSDDVLIMLIGGKLLPVVFKGSIFVLKEAANALSQGAGKVCGLIKSANGSFTFRLPGTQTAIPLGPDNLPSLLKARSLGRGSTGRTAPRNVNEQVAMKAVLADPLHGAQELAMSSPMTDLRWPGAAGWVKYSKKLKNIGYVSHFDKKANKVFIEKVETNIDIHFVYNQKTKQFDDFKFKDE